VGSLFPSFSVVARFAPAFIFMSLTCAAASVAPANVAAPTASGARSAAITPADGGRYPVGTEFVAPCHDWQPASLPRGQAPGDRIQQVRRWWLVELLPPDPEIADGTEPRYRIDGFPPDCTPKPNQQWSNELTDRAKRAGKHLLVLETDVVDWEWFCYDECEWGFVGASFAPESERIFYIFDRYRIELHAWIPQSAVVDPLRPEPTRWSRLATNCFTPPAAFKKTTIVRSAFRGDSHRGYEGKYRGRSWIEFEWDGNAISVTNTGGDFGPTHRDFVYTGWSRPLTRPHRCSIAKTAATAWRASATGAAFKLEVETANPLVPFAPDIDSALTGSFVPKVDELRLTWRTDLFPSHGFRVVRNDTAFTQVVENVACLRPFGWPGVRMLLKRLNSQTNSGSMTLARDSSDPAGIARCTP
jgi:hypothetical protein